MKIVIICGGKGTRLWPLSTRDKPKQFISLIDQKSLFEMTIERNLFLKSDYLVVSNKNYLDFIQTQASTINKKIILEPIAKNTAPAITLAALSCDPEEIILVLPSDHYIPNEDSYQKIISRAVQKAEENKLVLFGIKPLSAQTQYGYIQYQNGNVLSFNEKPDLAKAQGYLQDGNYLWNSGIFCFKAQTYLAELKKYAPEIYKKSQAALEQADLQENVYHIDPEHMDKIPNDSIDYAVMEKSKNLEVIPFEIEWYDLGSFESLKELADSDVFKK